MVFLNRKKRDKAHPFSRFQVWKYRLFALHCSFVILALVSVDGCQVFQIKMLFLRKKTFLMMITIDGGPLSYHFKNTCTLVIDRKIT